MNTFAFTAANTIIDDERAQWSFQQQSLSQEMIQFEHATREACL